MLKTVCNNGTWPWKKNIFYIKKFIYSLPTQLQQIKNDSFLFFQDKMADYMRRILGDMLYTAPPAEDAEAMPSPEKLKGKVLVKAKRLPPGKSQVLN